MFRSSCGRKERRPEDTECGPEVQTVRRKKGGTADLTKEVRLRRLKAEQAKKDRVYGSLENEKPKRIPVTAGISDGSYTELLSGGLKEGQEIIVESLIKAKHQSSFRPEDVLIWHS